MTTLAATPSDRIEPSDEDMLEPERPTAMDILRESRRARIRGDYERAGILHFARMVRLRRAQRDQRARLST